MDKSNNEDDLFKDLSLLEGENIFDMHQAAQETRRYRSEVRPKGGKKFKKSKTSALKNDTATKLDSLGGATPMLSPLRQHEGMIELN